MKKTMVTHFSSVCRKLVRICLLPGVLVFAGASLTAAAYEQNLEKTFEVAAGGKLIVEANRGSIAVKPDGGENVKIRVLREVKGGTKVEADRILGEHQVTFAQEGNTVSVVGKSKQTERWSLGLRRPSLQVRYEISVPARFNVDLKTAGGDISLVELDGYAITRTSSGLIDVGMITGKVEASNAGGDIRIGEIGGDLAVRTSSGSIKVQKGKGRVEATNSGGDIRVDEAGAAVSAKTSSGAIALVRVHGDAKVSNSGGDIKVESAAGNVDAQTSSGSINVGEVKGERVNAKNSGGSVIIGEVHGIVFAQTSSGTIEVKRAAGKIEATNSGGDIAIGEAQNGVAAQTSSGVIKIQSAKGKIEARNSGGDIRIGMAEKETMAGTSSGSITIKQAHGRVEARNSGGDIIIGEARDVVLAQTSSGTLNVAFIEPPKTECRLEVSGGGISVALPANAELNLDARTSGGEVVSDLPVSLNVVRAGHIKDALQGKINKGGPTLVLRASSGDIRLKKSPASVRPAEAEDPAK